ncbi:MAG: hypothetical protein R3350_08795, partial [Saprospiraceae bacterium]|nr:hypothetical protein [Saprospiraceae bacterium]
MGLRYALFSLMGLFFLTTSCKQDIDPVWLDGYAAHLELDTTTLIVSTVADSLEVPWEVAWGSDEHLWFTEQNGSVYRLDVESGARRLLLRIPDVHYQKSRGLLGMALPSDLYKHPYV